MMMRKKSFLTRKLLNYFLHFPGGPHYTQMPYIMTPIPKITKKCPVSPEKHYSTMHTQTHTAVIDTIKQLKSRWKVLQANCNKQFEPPAVAMIIIACCVLHNICNKRGLPIIPMTQTEERLEAMKQKVANGPVPRKQTVNPDGDQARSRLVERLWNERRLTPDNTTSKKRAKAKERVMQPHQPPQPQPIVQHQQHQNLAICLPHQMHQQHHEDLNKRPRLMTLSTPTYGLNVPTAPVWGHYPHPQH